MVEVTCDKCGQRCEVPFRPTSGKPVYCKNCFKKEDNSGQREKSNQFEREFEQINQKLDKIISALEI
jgi:CxxC-x17-CxxC domain-containing protein